MLDPYWQYEIPLWFLFLLILVVLLLPLELGFRLGLRELKLHPDHRSESAADVTLAAMLTLLGLMLAFTYSFSMSRADLRKQAITTEVNAIGTAFLRADLAPEAVRTELRKSLLEYARTRVVAPGTLHNRQDLQAAVDRSMVMQAKIWPATRSAVQQEGMSEQQKALLVTAINEVLDAHTNRLTVIYDRLPTVVLLLLLLIAGASLGVAAYNTILTGKKCRWRMTAFTVILAALVYIILDFDMVMRGFIQVNHGPLVTLVRDMEETLP